MPSNFHGLIRAMDRAGVSQSVLCGLPTTFHEENFFSFDTNTDAQLIELYEKLSEDYQKRFLPFICSIHPDNESSIEWANNYLSEHQESIFGFGEIICRHDRMSLKVFGHEIPPNTPTMCRLYDLAAKHQLPVLLHSNISSPGSTVASYSSEIMDAASHNSNCTIVWAHCGISKGIHIYNLLEEVRQLLALNPNLCVDISWLVYDYYIAESEKSLFEWANLIEEYADRFLIGTDHTGNWSDYCNTVSKYRKLLALLDKRTRRLVSQENATRIISRKSPPTKRRASQIKSTY